MGKAALLVRTAQGFFCAGSDVDGYRCFLPASCVELSVALSGMCGNEVVLDDAVMKPLRVGGGEMEEIDARCVLSVGEYSVSKE